MDALFGTIGDVLTNLSSTVTSANSRLWPLYLLTTLLIAYGVYRAQRHEGSFLKWLFPKAIYFHPSHIVDLKVFVLNRLFTALGVFGLVFFGAHVASFVVEALGPSRTIAPFAPWVIALMILVVNDFAVYWVHRIHHESRIFWPFHSLHHSAEVMTPITVFRKHPVYDLVSSLIKGLLIGTLQGLCLWSFGQMPSYAMLVGVNAAYVLFNMAGSNLRHTHVWLSFGPVLEHIFISPAQHQVHHSIDPKHHNKNYGEVLAIWDWMFGTLYVPQTRETIAFGLGNAKGERLKQRHDSLRNAMVVPLKDAWKQLRKALGFSPRGTATPPRAPERALPPAE